MYKYIKCFNCCRRFTPGTRSDGLPEGVKMCFSDGTFIDLCTDCISAFGRSDECLHDFLKKLEVRKNA